MVGLTQGDLLGLAGVYGYVLCVLAVAWSMKGKVRNQRKLVHILTGGIVFFWWSFDTREVMAGLAAFPFVVLLLLATPRSPVAFLRDSPFGARSSEGHPYGLVMYSLSWTLIAYFLFDDLYAGSIAIAAMSFGDGMGELVGRRFGKREYMPHRTLEGTFAVFVGVLLSILALYLFYFELINYPTSPPALLPVFAVVVAALVALLEAITPGSVDNVVIPLAVAFLLTTMGV